MAASPLLDVKGLHLRLTRNQASSNLVNDVSFQVFPGQCTALVGESGSGKTLTARAVAGLLPEAIKIESGSIRFCDEEITTLSPEALRLQVRRRIGVIFQEPAAALNPRQTIFDQISEAVDPDGVLARSERASRSWELLNQVRMPGPERVAIAFPHELSGGMNQRAGIAMALARRPSLLIADEATTALDTTTQAEILQLIRTLCRETGTGLILITHDLGLVQDYADNVHVMRMGQVVENGAVNDVLGSASHPYTRTLIEATPHILAERDGEFAIPAATAQRPGFIRAHSVSRTYASVRGHAVAALKSIDVEIGLGESVGLVGESGSGKSTLSRMLAGIEQPDSGGVLIDGAPVWSSRATSHNWRRDVQMIFQDPLGSLDPYMTIAQSIEQPLIVNRVGNRKERARKVASLLDEVGLSQELAHRLPAQLSGGQRQRAGIARALVLDPKILLADEPVSALDLSVQATIIKLLRRLQRERGLTLLLVTHDLSVVRLLTSRLYIIQHGRIVEHGPTEAVMRSPTHPHTRALIAAIPGHIQTPVPIS